MPNVPFPEYVITSNARAWWLPVHEWQLISLRRDWAGNGATELVAETLRLAIRLDHLYADYCAMDDTDFTDADIARFVAVENAFGLPGMGSVFGLALDVSDHLEWIDTDERERFGQDEYGHQPTKRYIARHIEALQTAWLIALRDAFADIVALFPAQVSEPVKVVS